MMREQLINGYCNCRNIHVAITLARGESLGIARECDCDFCQQYKAAYVSNPRGAVKIHIKEKDKVDYLKQGTDTAFFIVCTHCGELISANYTEGKSTYSSINKNILENVDQLQQEIVSLRLLNQASKVSRWKALWFNSSRVQQRMQTRVKKITSMINGYTITTDQSKMDFNTIHDFIAHSYWAKGIPKATLKKAMENSMCFAVLTERGEQVGFARMISDNATFAYLADVFVLEEHRGKGISKWLMETIMAHPDLQNLRRMLLATADAHGLYQQYGFSPLKNPARFMESCDPSLYQIDT